MDELEFRRRLLADPQDKDPALLEAKSTSASNQRLANELEQLDAMIDQTLRVDVPDDLADKILFKQTSDAVRESRQPRFHLAIAASVAFVFGILLGQFNWQPIPQGTNNLGQIALTHYYDEEAFNNNIFEQASVTQVNAKLVPFGVNFKGQLPGEIAYVNHCSFNDRSALHMILEKPDGQRYTVFVVPEASVDSERFTDGNMEAVVLPAGENRSLIVVGKEGMPVKPLAEQLTADLNQSI